jgi:UDP-N-acetylglucosamine--N-acetylmuramyl-(pentapeptide) pyrophosphoryl-undecaprenol N-acetylglucosamine transferase
MTAIDSPIVLAGGGTGGHVFPLLALAQSFAKYVGRDRLVCVGTERGLEAKVIPENHFSLRVLKIEPIKGRTIYGTMRGAMVAGVSVVQSVSLLRKLRPAVVVSVGGYAAGPVSLAASILRVPLYLLEPNRIFGLTQRLLRPLAHRVFVGFPESVQSARDKHLGIPLRDGFQPISARVRDSQSPLRVLVMGGSQGAEFLNQQVPVALTTVGETRAIEVVHQTGKGREQDVRDRYANLIEKGVSVEVMPFLSDVPVRLAHCDLLIARAGAMTIAEACAVGRPMLLVPYPFAADDHQAHNAKSIELAGAGLSLIQAGLTADRIAQQVARIADDEPLRQAMCRAAAARGVAQSADLIAQQVLADLRAQKAVR